MTTPSEALNWRYATKLFSDKKISREDLFQLTESLRLAPSSFGLQLWHFYVISNKELQEELKEKAWKQPQIDSCSHLVVLCRPEKFENSFVNKFIQSTATTRGQNESELEGYKKMMLGMINGMTEDKQKYWMENQVYIALGQLMTAAAFMKVDSCPIEGFAPEEFDKILKLEEKGLKSVVVCALGYRNNEDKYAHATKVRYKEEEIITHL